MVNILVPDDRLRTSSNGQRTFFAQALAEWVRKGDRGVIERSPPSLAGGENPDLVLTKFTKISKQNLEDVACKMELAVQQLYPQAKNITAHPYLRVSYEVKDVQPNGKVEVHFSLFIICRISFTDANNVVRNGIVHYNIDDLGPWKHKIVYTDANLRGN